MVGGLVSFCPRTGLSLPGDERSLHNVEPVYKDNNYLILWRYIMKEGSLKGGCALILRYDGR